MNVKFDLMRKIKGTSDVLLHYAPMQTLLCDLWGKPMEEHLSDWIIKHPDAFQDTLIKSFDAGCDLASTSTQAASPWRAGVYGLKDRVYEMNYQSAKLAREVTPEDRCLVGFMSSSNPGFLEPFGQYSYNEVYSGYQQQISALIEGGVDALMIAGSQTNVNAICIEAAKDMAPGFPVIAQNLYYMGMTGHRTIMGEEPCTGTKMLVDAGADIVGASCGLMRRAEDIPEEGPSHYYEGATEVVALMRQGCDKPLSIQPNAGIARLVGGVTVYVAPPEEMAAEVEKWMEAGARIVGGCCGTSIRHYEMIAAIVHKRNAEKGAKQDR